MSNKLRDHVSSSGVIPLSWVAKTKSQTYLNLGDALSPVIVSMISGLPVQHVASKSKDVRLAAVGTIGHMFKDGDVSFWGTGTSPHLNPSAAPDKKLPYTIPNDTAVEVYATRGPFTRNLLCPTSTAPAVYGDPLWLLPRFHKAPTEKKYELGVILHLSELGDRSFQAVPKQEHRRYDIPQAQSEYVRLINTVTEPSIEALRNRLDEILSCKRIVSTSLHGMVFAESYGIPCLYFSPRADDAGFARLDLTGGTGIDLRFDDLYRGLGQPSLDLWYQPRRDQTDWDNLIREIDLRWFVKTLDEQALIDAFPIRASPIAVPPSGSAFDHPLIKMCPIDSQTPNIQPKSWSGKLLARFR